MLYEKNRQTELIIDLDAMKYNYCEIQKKVPNKKILPDIARGKIEKNIFNKKITIIITGGITKLGEKSASIFAGAGVISGSKSIPYSSKITFFSFSFNSCID